MSSSSTSHNDCTDCQEDCPFTMVCGDCTDCSNRNNCDDFPKNMMYDKCLKCFEK